VTQNYTTIISTWGEALLLTL